MYNVVAVVCFSVIALALFAVIAYRLYKNYWDIRLMAPGCNDSDISRHRRERMLLGRRIK